MLDTCPYTAEREPSCKLWALVTMTGPCRLRDWDEGCARVGAGPHGKSLYLPARFAVNLNLC